MKNIEFVAHGASSFPVELVNALDDLQNTSGEAIEEGFPVPSGIALENADRLLREMYRILPRRFEVYPTPDGEIAIDAPGGHGRSVLLLSDVTQFSRKSSISPQYLGSIGFDKPQNRGLLRNVSYYVTRKGVRCALSI